MHQTVKYSWFCNTQLNGVEVNYDAHIMGILKHLTVSWLSGISYAEYLHIVPTIKNSVQRVAGAHANAIISNQFLGYQPMTLVLVQQSVITLSDPLFITSSINVEKLGCS